MFGSNPINFSVDILFGEDGQIEIDDEQRIRRVVEKLIDVDSFELFDRTHEHTPWKKDEKEINSGFKGMKYSLEELRLAYKENKKFND